MKSKLIFYYILFFSSTVIAQSYFDLSNKVDKVKVPFVSSANLIIVKAELNNVPLNFIVDTGSDRTLIFGFVGVDSIEVNRGKLMRYQGADRDGYFEAYLSKGNKISLNNDLFNNDSELLILTDDKFDLSAQIGIPIHGLIGSDLFNELLVEVDYQREQLIFYRSNKKNYRRFKKYDRIPLNIVENKPYVNSLINNDSISLNLMIDTGNSDALWLYSSNKIKVSLPDKGFKDYLGYGLLGEIDGLRSKLHSFQIGDFSLTRPTVSYPNLSTENLNYLKDDFSNGSIGGGMLRRFRILFDYKNEKLVLIPNKYFKNEFYYNMSGMQIKSKGFDIKYSNFNNNNNNNIEFENQKGIKIYSSSVENSLRLSPKLIVSSVNYNSPASRAGLKIGDQIVKINSRTGLSLTLKSATNYFYQNPYSILKIKYVRNGIVYKTKLQLIPLIE